MNFNKDVSEYFLSDAKDFLERYLLLSVRSNDISWRCKLLVELLFSLECAMKAIIFIESREKELQTYQKARSGGHKLALLYSKLSLKSQQAYDACILHDLKNYFVDMRYMLDGRLTFTEEQGVLTREYYETIANPSWLNETSRQVSDFIKYVESTNPFVIKTTRFSEIDILSELGKQKEIRAMANFKKK